MESNNITWYSYHGALLPKVEPHIELNISTKEAKQLLKKSGAYFLRYTTAWDSEKVGEFWYVINDTFSEMDVFSANTRSKIRRGFKNCWVEKVTKEEISKSAYEVYSKAFERYDTPLKVSSKKVFTKNIIESEGYDYFAVYEKKSNLMIAYSSNKIVNGVCNYTTIKFHPNYLKLYSSYVLFYEMNQYYLESKAFLYVHDGARSIAHDTNIHDFLIDKFRFRKSYCRLNIIYRWDIALIINILYPFKSLIEKSNHHIFKKIFIVLKQEGIRRSFE
ncbi:MAG: Unknown protein [uncultured Sulfurovum sp.]|uniref:BioF2-like acetyltransferase domain-containing protein n=1 Tax=uncultured Sulfurovum sp. TaxID=269237 RepID=A0A6S6T7F3_9BACT|nr:MAG: Unknown protein [uncultured Sulfurovum sp.]